MHQASTTPRRSIYFDYQVFPAAARPAHASVAPVVIVGAGPIGMTLALDLARHGVASVVLESEQQVSEGSRAIVFTRRSMEILQQAGVDHEVTAQGLPWRFGNSFYRGQRVFRMEAPHSDDDRFFPMINLQQQLLEQALVKRIQASPLIEVRWGHRVTAVVNAGLETSHAEIEVDTPQGPYRQPAQYVVASDGARSGIRSSLGLKMEGSTYEGRFVIADIRVDLPLPTERLAFFDPAWNPQNTVLMHREPLGIWRIDYQLAADETPEQALHPESLRKRINAQLEMIGHAGIPWEMDWSSVYSARALTLPDYRHGRIVFVGDAAHMLPIFGVRGANTGFQDSQNLGWKLAYVLRDLAPSKLLDTYTHERVMAAREIVQEAGKSTRFMTPPTRGFRLLRDAVLSLSLTQEFVRPLYHWRTSRPHAYSDSVLSCLDDDDGLFESGPAKGDSMRNVLLGPDHYLMDEFPAGFLLLVFASVTPLDGTVHSEMEESVRAQLRTTLTQAREQGLAVKVLWIESAQQANRNTPSGFEGALHDTHQRIAKAYGVKHAGAAYLLRPDQHVCARWRDLNAPALSKALARAVMRDDAAGF